MGIFEFRQMPQPDLSMLKDDSEELPLSKDYMPAVMQAMQYFTEVLKMFASVWEHKKFDGKEFN